MMVRDRAVAVAKGKKTLRDNLLSGKTTFKVTHGKRVLVGDTWMRSTYEARFANMLSLLNLAWEYEPKYFPVHDGKTYLPDFYVPSLDLYVEIKGWWRDDAKEKFDAFITLYPTLRCALVNGRDLKSLEQKETTLEACIITQRG
jgi:predicted nuclease of restriction endonuclease-like RecB superfamily